MKPNRFRIPLQFAIFIFQFAICNSPAFADPTLARLSFWIPPARMTEFEAAYEAKAVPILKKHGLTPSSERARAGPDSIFSRLFELKAVSELEERRKTLADDPAWKATLQGLGAAFATAKDGTIRYGLTPYSAPAGSGKVVSSGPGRKAPARWGTGHWRTHDLSDGVTTAGDVSSILQDREGNLWFGTPSGVCRYNGWKFTNFTTRDGLAHNWAQVVFQDREGNLWFGTLGGGVSRYDGKTFATFTAKDGLTNNRVSSIIQDREGNLWFGAWGDGVSRFDGQTWTTFTARDGLADNRVRSILQDREGNLWFGTWPGGATCYRQPAAWPPPVFVDAVVADRRYEKVSDLTIPSSVGLTVFEFHAISFKTRPEA